MIKVLVSILGWLANLGTVGKALLGAILFILWMIFWSSVMFSDISASLDAFIIPSFPSTVDLSPLSLVNYIFPINETITIILAVAAAKALAVTVRVIKSWIPTVG